MEFHDFQIRAWTVDEKHAAVLVHSSPAGSMRRPETVIVDWNKLDAFMKIFHLPSETSYNKAASRPLTIGGHELGNIVFPDSVVGLLIRSLERIDTEDGLRLRLCLDSILSDLPWEYLIPPNIVGLKSPGGFLALDARISLVREPPYPGRLQHTNKKKQRLLFYGTRQCNTEGKDIWEAAQEKDKLFRALEPVSSLLQKEAVLSNETDCQTAIMRSMMPIDIFHYSGHTDVENNEGYLIASDVKSGSQDFDRLYANTLGPLLRRSRTTVAVFSACNSGSWAFIEPLLLEGLPVVIGVQGIVYVPVAIAFCQRLYSAISIGLSIDEAVTWARLHLLEPGVMLDSLKWQWGVFMVYMQTPEAVLFPKQKHADILQSQKKMRNERQQTIINVEKLIYQDIDTKIGKMEGGKVIGSSVGQISKK
jgi:hypothetical protein